MTVWRARGPLSFWIRETRAFCRSKTLIELEDLGWSDYFSGQPMEAFEHMEGIIPALETAHAFAWLEQLCPTLPQGTEVVINCSGRGDKDVNTVAEKLGDQLS